MARHARSASHSFVGFLADDEPDSRLLGQVGATWPGPIAELEVVEADYVIAIGDPAVCAAVHALASGGVSAAATGTAMTVTVTSRASGAQGEPPLSA